MLEKFRNIFPYSVSNTLVNVKVSNPYVVWCERYIKDNLFERKKGLGKSLMHP
jgi:hypothetical protein